MINERTAKQKVIDGFKLVGWLLLGFVVIGLLLRGTMDLAGKVDNPSRLRGIVFLLIGVSALWATVDRWNRYFGGFFLLPATLAAFASIFTGTVRGNPRMQIDRLTAVEYFVICLVSLILCFRFDGKRRLNITSKVCVCLAAASLTSGAVLQATMILALTPMFLAIPWLAELARRRRKLMG